jgi:hypothetical protein
MPHRVSWRLRLGVTASLTLTACSPAPNLGPAVVAMTLGPAVEPATPVGTNQLTPVATPSAATASPGATGEAAAPSPGLPGGTGGSGGGAPALPPPEVTFEGVVTDLDSGAPLAGAQVQALAYDGPVTGETDAAGRFSLKGRMLAKEVAASADGHVPRVTAGWDGQAAAVALRPVAPPPAFFGADPGAMPLSGTVLDETGAPVAGAHVVGADGAGNTFGPVDTDSAGRFSGMASVAVAIAPAGMALLAYREAPAGLAVARRTPDAAGRVGALTLQGAAGRVELLPAWPAGNPSAAVIARVADGPELALGAWRFGQPGIIEAPYFDVAGVSLIAEAQSAEPGARSSWTRAVTGPGAIAGQLLPLLDEPTGPVRAGAPLAWPAVAGAEGYTLTLRAPDTQVLRWEATTRAPAVTLLELPPGGGTLEITAHFTDDFRSTRRVALDP